MIRALEYLGRYIESEPMHLDWRDQYFLCLCVVHVLRSKFIWVIYPCSTNASSYCQTYIWIAGSGKSFLNVPTIFSAKLSKLSWPVYNIYGIVNAKESRNLYRFQSIIYEARFEYMYWNAKSTQPCKASAGLHVHKAVCAYIRI